MNLKLLLGTQTVIRCFLLMPTDALFSLLLRLATASNGDVLNCPSSPLVGVACACLLSLVVARGETGKFLRATADILMTSRQLATQSIQVIEEGIIYILIIKFQRYFTNAFMLPTYTEEE